MSEAHIVAHTVAAAERNAAICMQRTDSQEKGIPAEHHQLPQLMLSIVMDR
jgi:hypothetical protein